jgi:hypothetical protein
MLSGQRSDWSSDVCSSDLTPLQVYNYTETEIRYDQLGVLKASEAVNALYDQTITGIKNFKSRPTVNGTGVMLNGEAAQLPTTLVYTTGNQFIEGNKTISGILYDKNNNTIFDSTINHNLILSDENTTGYVRTGYNINLAVTNYMTSGTGVIILPTGSYSSDSLVRNGGLLRVRYYTNSRPTTIKQRVWIGSSYHPTLEQTLYTHSGDSLPYGTNLIFISSDGVVWEPQSIAGNFYNDQLDPIDVTRINGVAVTGGQTISGNKIFSDQITFNSTSVTAPNQTITNSSSILTKGLADNLYGSNYFAITTGLSSGVDNDAIGKKVHSFTLPSGTWEFECYATLSGSVSTVSQGTRFYMYPSNSYSFYGQNSRNAAINSFAIPQTSSITLTNSNLAFSLYNIANNLISACHLKGTLIINQQTEVPIFISQNIQQTGQPIYLMQGSYLKAKKIS